MSVLKTGDKVFYRDDDNNIVEVGILIITKEHEDDNGVAVEADLEMHYGGSVSPVGLDDCEIVSDKLYSYLSHLEKIKMAVGDIAENQMGMYWIEG